MKKNRKKFVFSGLLSIFVAVCYTIYSMLSMKEHLFKVFYLPDGAKQVACAMLPSLTIKQALTRFKAAGFDGEVYCIQRSDFDSSLFNF